MRLRVGAHVPTRGHLPNAVDIALERGCDTFQVFVSNPRAWAPPNHPPHVYEEFRQRRESSGLAPAVVHASYMVNIASPDPVFLRRSVDLARREAAAVAAMGADGLVVHAGAGGSGERAAAIERAAASALAIAEEGAPVLLELTAGGAGTVASTIPEAAMLFDACGRDPRLGLVLDTCHLFAAGAPLDHPDGVADTFVALRRARLASRVRIVHANDAKDPCGSRRDRHEHVGQGYIGETGFRAILSDPAVRRAGVLIETPGEAEEDRRNLALLRTLAG